MISPSHTDATYDFKYGVRSVQGGGRSSARDTIGKVADLIIGMREALRGNLEDLGSPLSWNHVTDQIGMFCYSD
jgi:chorismate synthase